MNDLISLAIRQAIELFGPRGDGVFNAAGFSTAFIRLAGVTDSLDGKVVRAMLCGRSDVEVLLGGAHFRLRETPPPSKT